MGMRMSRSPGGGSSKGIMCKHGESGARGMGANFSGGKNTGKTRAWSNPGMTTSRPGNSKPWAAMPDRYQAVSHNPSGAPNKVPDGS